jgi:hypothetical protein
VRPASDKTRAGSTSVREWDRLGVPPEDPDVEDGIAWIVRDARSKMRGDRRVQKIASAEKTNSPDV